MTGRTDLLTALAAEADGAPTADPWLVPGDFAPAWAARDEDEEDDADEDDDADDDDDDGDDDDFDDLDDDEDDDFDDLDDDEDDDFDLSLIHI